MIAQVRVQVLAVERCLDLAGVGLADGGDHVAVGQAALEHVGVIVALLQRVLVEHILRKSGPVADRRDIEDALEAQVVDGEHDLGTAQRRILEHGTEIDRDQARLPVVAVDHVRDPVHVVQGCQSCLAEVAVLRDVGDQIRIGIAVAEELLVVDEIIDDAVPDVLHDSHIVGLSIRAQIHLKGAAVHHLLLILLRDALISRKDDLDVAVLLDQRLRKSVHDIAQSAGLDEGIALGADEGDASSGLRDLRSRRCLGSGFLCRRSLWSGFLHRCCSNCLFLDFLCRRSCFFLDFFRCRSGFFLHSFLLRRSLSGLLLRLFLLFLNRSCFCSRRSLSCLHFFNCLYFLSCLDFLGLLCGLGGLGGLCRFGFLYFLVCCALFDCHFASPCRFPVMKELQ